MTDKEKNKLIEDMRKYFTIGEKLHIGKKVYVLWEDIMWVLDTALKETK